MRETAKSGPYAIALPRDGNASIAWSSEAPTRIRVPGAGQSTLCLACADHACLFDYQHIV